VPGKLIIARHCVLHFKTKSRTVNDSILTNMPYSSAISKKTNPGKVNAIHKQQNSFFVPVLQPKLQVNQPNDMYEQEADAMADRVMRMPDPTPGDNLFFKPAVSSIQRKCAHCEEEEKKAQRKETNDEAVITSTQTEDYINSLSGGKTLMKRRGVFLNREWVMISAM
jgi:hypothetical protein